MQEFNAEEGGTYSNQCTFLSANVSGGHTSYHNA